MKEIEYSLRQLELRDSARMLEWMRDPEITRYLQIGGPDTKEETVVNFIQSSGDESVNLHRAVVNSTDEYVGTVSLKNIDHEKGEAEYAISMHSSALGTGAAAAATQLILEAAFHELNLTRVYLNVRKENMRAIRFYEKNKFRYTHTTTAVIRGVSTDLKWYEISDE